METSDEWLERLRDESAARLEQVAVMQQELASVVGRAASDRGEVTVAVTPSGSLLELDLAPSAMNLGATALSRLILSTTAQATAQAAERVRAVVAPVMDGADVDALLAGHVPPSTRAEVDAELEQLAHERQGRS